jgi:hypothetical protein
MIDRAEAFHDDTLGTDETDWSPQPKAPTMNPPLRIFIGFDPRQAVAYNVLAMSIIEHASVPVQISPLVIQQLPIARQGLTPFTWTRFLVPWLCGFEGEALFVDADMLFLADPAELFDHARIEAMGKYAAGHQGDAVAVREDPDGHKFERAALIWFNCAHPDNRVLTPEYIEEEKPGRALHWIDWTKNIARIPDEWGHLVGYNAPRAAGNHAKLAHYTQGIPVFPETWECEYAAEWQRIFAATMIPAAAQQIQIDPNAWTALMGGSVHAKRLPSGRMVPKFWQETEIEPAVPA